MEWIAQPQAWVALATLTALEIVLGIDNIVFISILAGRLPKNQRNKARTLGLALAMGTRILLLLTLTWIMTLTAPLFHVFRRLAYFLQGIEGDQSIKGKLPLTV